MIFNSNLIILNDCEIYKVDFLDKDNFEHRKSNSKIDFLDIDVEKALKLGVNLSDLYTTIGAFMGGAYVNDFTRFGRLKLG